jgi:integrase
MKVTLRQRKKGSKISLYLDYYNKSKRKYEYLKLYLYPTPEKGSLSKLEKEHNKTTLQLAETIRAKRQIEIQSGIYGFNNNTKLKASFIRYFAKLTKEREDSSPGNHGNWNSTLKHLKNYCKQDVLFEDIDVQWLKDIREYFDKKARTTAGTLLKSRTKNSYFSKIRAAINQAQRDGIIITNPIHNVKGIKSEDSERQFLTQEELQAAANVECDSNVLKRAFLFSALTGLRWSDVQKLTWDEIQHSDENGWYIRFTQQKTKGVETLPISDSAIKLLGEKIEGNDRAFVGLKYSSWCNVRLRQWMLRAGITKSVTFHSARHTYATLLLSKGADIFTVSKLLGHRDLKTTMIYAKIIDEKKREAADKISLEL